MSVDIKIKLDENKIRERWENEEVGLETARQWKRLIDPYTPYDKGNLQYNSKTKPYEIIYKQPYAHYMYTGTVYVDPVYNVGGFYSEGYGWWSRPNVKKIPSNPPRSFNYNTSKHPQATDHWDYVAAKNGQADKLAQRLSEYLQRYKSRYK